MFILDDETVLGLLSLMFGRKGQHMTFLFSYFLPEICIELGKLAVR